MNQTYSRIRTSVESLPYLQRFLDRVDRSQARRSLILASLHVGAFVVICGLSYSNLPGIAIVISIVLGLLALSAAGTAWLLSVSVIGFQYLFRLTPHDLLFVSATVMLAYVIRLLPNSFREAKQISPLWMVLASFLCLVAFHLDPIHDPQKAIEALLFGAVLGSAFLQGRGYVGTLIGDAVIIGICLVGLAASALSFLYLYGPAPILFLSHSPNYELALNDMRLSGALDGPNALAKLAIPVVLYGLLSICRPGGAGAGGAAALVFSGIILAAAGSKSVIIALVPSTVCALWFASKSRRLMFASLAVAGSLAITYCFSVSVLPWLKAHAAEGWEASSEPNMDAAYYRKLAEQSYFGIILSEFRIKTSQNSGDAGRSARVTTLEEIASSGQRLQLFKAGMLVVERHPFWGIGYKNWGGPTKEILGTSFVSPHNGFLEVFGSYGIVGAIVYAAMVLICARNFWSIEVGTAGTKEKYLNRGITLFVLTLLVHELAEVATILALTPYAFWVWSALGMQDGLVRRLNSQRSAVERQ